MFKPQLTSALAASILFALLLSAPAAAGQEQGGVLFKAPDGWIPEEKTEAGPIVFFNPEKPAVIYITYPPQGETTTEAQRQRLRKMAAKMFFHDENTALEWQVKSIPSHPGDGDGKADIATAKKGDMEVQVVTYERTTGTRPFIYGYVAMRSKKSKAPFIDEQGKGSKDFDKLWKSFPK